MIRAERLHRELGLPLSYYTNVDLDQDPDVLSGARGYVSMGHDEYWTPAMREAVERARDGGTNLAFLGANTMYWRIRLDDTGSGPARLQTGYRHDAYVDPLRDQRPVEATSRFRDEPAAESEQSLVGMEYECYPVDVDLTIVSPHWWGFRGTASASATASPGSSGSRPTGSTSTRARRARWRCSATRRTPAAEWRPPARPSTTPRGRAQASSRRGRCAGAAHWSTRASGRWARACSGSCSG